MTCKTCQTCRVYQDEICNGQTVFDPKQCEVEKMAEKIRRG